MVFEKLKNLRGLLYKKVSEAAAPEAQSLGLPDFVIKSSSPLVEFQNIEDTTKVNITYPLIEPFAYTNIKWNPTTKELEYLVLEPQLTEDEKKFTKQISDALIELLEVGLNTVKDHEKVISYLQEQVQTTLRELGLVLDSTQYTKIMYYIYRNFVGLNEIEPMLQDPNIEDISCDGTNTPIYVVHRKYGSIKTNVIYPNLDNLVEFIIKLAERAGRYVSYAEPILDGTLPDGSRVAATLAGDVATRGPTFTIRKFSEKPLSPIDQMDLGTCDENILAYLWYLVEHGASMLIVGGVSTGKTSFLNTVSMFIPPEAKIISIEDTREIRIPHQHWIAGLARTGFGLPTASGEKYGEVTLFDLLRESFRQNPDYVIVGEVRGNETYVMFQGMSSGHPSLSTFHAGSVDTVIKRLITPPIELSPSLLESLDVIVVMVHAKEKGKSARRVKDLSEIVSVDPKTQEVNSNVVFEWDPVTDKFNKVNDSKKLEKFATANGLTLQDALIEIENRTKILEWMHAKNLKSFEDTSKYINLYYKEPEKLLQEVGATVIPKKVQPQPVPVEVVTKPIEQTVPQPVTTTENKEKKRERRASLLDLLGFKILSEK